jgi:hypothetical protein
MADYDILNCSFTWDLLVIYLSTYYPTSNQYVISRIRERLQGYSLFLICHTGRW